MTDFERHSPLFQERHSVALWTGMFAGPVVWMVQFLTLYVLVPQVCGGGLEFFLLHVPTLIGLPAALLGTALAWRNWQKGGRVSPAEQDPPEITRTRFLAMLGLMTGSLFSLLIVAQWLAVLFLPPCPP